MRRTAATGHASGAPRIRAVGNGDISSNIDNTDSIAGGTRAITRSVADAPLPPDGDWTPAIRQTVLREALVEALGTPLEGSEAMGARVKALLGLGLRRGQGEAPGRGRGHRNGLPDALELAVALILQRLFVPPSVSVALIVENRGMLDAAWTSTANGNKATVTVAIDALAHTGRDGIRSGRFSENPAGTLVIVHGRSVPPRRRGVPAPQVTIDLHEVYNCIAGSLRRAGMTDADLRRAEDLIASGVGG